jgi:hypothetical protein
MPDPKKTMHYIFMCEPGNEFPKQKSSYHNACTY